MTLKNSPWQTTIGAWFLLAAAWFNLGSVSLAAGSAPSIYLGQPSALMVQPYIVAEVFVETYPGSGEYLSLGPSPDIEGGDLLGDLFRDIYGPGFNISDELLLGTPNSSLLLDTGANSIILVDTAAQDLITNGLETDGKFLEVGVGGDHNYDVSLPYRFGVTGSNGNTHYLESVRLQVNPEGVLAAPVAMGGIAGLAGMPAMTGRVTSLTMTDTGTEYPSGAIEEWNEWELIALLAGGMDMSTTFSNDLPAVSSGSRYTVALDNRIQFAAEDGRPPDAAPDSPLPIYADVPFLTATVAKVSEVDEVYREAESTFLLDTGAQFSMISRRTAFMLGLDKNGDGDLWDDRFDFIDVTGVGGPVSVPILCIDEIRVATEQGPELVWNDPSGTVGVQVIVLDIIPSADVNYDGIVDSLDLGLITTSFGRAVSEIEFPLCDINDDNLINQDDLDYAQSQLGETIFFDGIFGIDMLTGGRNFLSSENIDNTAYDVGTLQAQIDDLQSQLDDLDPTDPFYFVDQYTLSVQLAQAQINMELLLSGSPGELAETEFAGTSFFNAAHFDFRDWANGHGSLVLDIDSAYSTVVSPEIPGDANGDGKVDGSDVTILAGNWQETVAGGAADGDFNGDGVVDGSDVTILAGNWQYGTAQPSVPGDANGDGKVDGSDVTILAGNWQATVTGGAGSGDFNGDGKVDGSDVTILAGNWQYGVNATAAAVPEPSMWILLASLGSLFFLRSRQKSA